jgi:hypothetical protein
MDGKLIGTAGTNVGGGKSVRRGGMRLAVVDFELLSGGLTQHGTNLVIYCS